jgi:hypothetical protein
MAPRSLILFCITKQDSGLASVSELTAFEEDEQLAPATVPADDNVLLTS